MIIITKLFLPKHKSREPFYKDEDTLLVCINGLNFTRLRRKVQAYKMK